MRINTSLSDKTSINDSSTTSGTQTWSCNKINTELAKKTTYSAINQSTCSSGNPSETFSAVHYDDNFITRNSWLYAKIDGVKYPLKIVGFSRNSTLWEGSVASGGTLKINNFDYSKYEELIFVVHDSNANVYSTPSMPIAEAWDTIKNSNYGAPILYNASGGWGFARFEISTPSGLSTGATITLGISTLTLVRVIGVLK